VWVFFVTGVSDAGKSTLARRMAEWGHRAVSTDADSQLCAWTALDGCRVDRPAEPDMAWLAAHEWRWDRARLDQIITAAARQGDEALWLFGHAANARDVADRFDATFLLEIDQQTMIARMGNPARGNDLAASGTACPRPWPAIPRSSPGGAGTARPSSTPPATWTRSRRSCSWPPPRRHWT
jgi:hypothetical protein